MILIISTWFKAASNIRTGSTFHRFCILPELISINTLQDEDLSHPPLETNYLYLSQDLIEVHTENLNSYKKIMNLLWSKIINEFGYYHAGQQIFRISPSNEKFVRQFFCSEDISMDVDNFLRRHIPSGQFKSFSEAIFVGWGEE